MTKLDKLCNELAAEVRMNERVLSSYRDMVKQLESERDELLAICFKWEMPLPDSVCRVCDRPMSMRKWENQLCYTCGGEA